MSCSVGFYLFAFLPVTMVIFSPFFFSNNFEKLFSTKRKLVFHKEDCLTWYFCDAPRQSHISSLHEAFPELLLMTPRPVGVDSVRRGGGAVFIMLFDSHNVERREGS